MHMKIAFTLILACFVVACAKPKGAALTASQEPKRSAYEQALASPEALRAAGLGAVSLGAVVDAGELLFSIDLPVQVVVQRMGGYSQPIVLGSEPAIGGPEPVVKPLEPGDYKFSSFEYPDTRRTYSSVFGGLVRTATQGKGVDFTVRAGEVLNLGHLRFVKYISDAEKEKPRRRRQSSWYVELTADSQDVQARFADDYASLVPLLQSRPVACVNCPPKPPGQ